ncbi:MAG: type II toxin-antitoxin system HicB family antitoxin [Lachnospiraceae bacterium]|nr:type II toxin-antitoxin system HicB family antitoxin [Lachnospiraceae bacterium]
MNNIMQYKGYVGSVEFSEEDCVLYGKVQGIRSLISYEGNSAQELLSDFHKAVDEYLALCETEGKKPETPYKGSLNLRFRNAETHRRAAIYALTHDQSLNSFIDACVVERLNSLQA